MRLKVQTKYFGEVEYDHDDLVTFPVGLFGFDDEHEYLLIPFEGNDGNLVCFQSTMTPGLAFVALNPFSLTEEYEPVLQPTELDELGVQESGELCYYTLCVVKKPVADSTVNLKCPVAINVTTRVARQVILENDAYEMRHPLSQFNPNEGDGLC